VIRFARRQGISHQRDVAIQHMLAHALGQRIGRLQVSAHGGIGICQAGKGLDLGQGLGSLTLAQQVHDPTQLLIGIAQRAACQLKGSDVAQIVFGLLKGSQCGIAGIVGRKMSAELGVV